ncbi:MAG: hypothetical protein OXN86_00930 [Chloroflexota bacterium]|nr:hypothetical protein [Chloroflexota bacterium]MDE2891058.1 hypothetical protein [Chloroflexota bacterium]
MLTVEEIQQAIVSLSSEDRGRLHEWMIECEDAWEDWDRQIAADSRAGKLDFLVAEAMEDEENGLLIDLPIAEQS